MRRRGFTLTELLIVIIIIVILAGMMTLSSNEAATSAKATKIINNLENLRTATTAWYVDNRDKVITASTSEAGQVKIIGHSPETRPIQEWPDSILGISSYLSGPAFSINENDKTSTRGYNTKLFQGNYGVYDAGEPRTTWYVGYHFTDTEDKVRDKVKLRAESLGLVFTDEADPFDIIKLERDNAGKIDSAKRINGEHAVWMKVLEIHTK